MKKFLIIIFSLSLTLTISGCNEKDNKVEKKEKEEVTEKVDTKPITVGNGVIAVSSSDIKNNEFYYEYVFTSVMKIITYEKYSYKLEEAKEYSNRTLKALKEAYPNEEDLKHNIYNYYKISTIESYENYMIINYLYQEYIKDKIKSDISEATIKKYYEEKVKENILVSLITLDNDDNLNTILNTLNNSSNKKETFISLAKKYSANKNLADNDSSLGYINAFNFSDKKLLEEAYKLKIGEYASFKDEYGYQIIYVEDIKEKDSYDTLRDKILEVLYEEKLSDDKYSKNLNENLTKELNSHPIWDIINEKETILIDTNNFILYDNEGKALTEYL